MTLTATKTATKISNIVSRQDKIDPNNENAVNPTAIKIEINLAVSENTTGKMVPIKDNAETKSHNTVGNIAVIKEKTAPINKKGNFNN
jgi:hypothetical protein